PSSPVRKLGHHSIDVSFGENMLLLKHYAREFAGGQCERNNSSERQPCSCLHERQSPFARFGSAEILLQKVHTENPRVGGFNSVPGHQIDSIVTQSVLKCRPAVDNFVDVRSSKLRRLQQASTTLA